MKHHYTAIEDVEVAQHIYNTKNMDNNVELDHIPCISNRYIEYTVITLALVSFTASFLIFVVLDSLNYDNKPWHCQEGAAHIFAFLQGLKLTWALKALTCVISESVNCFILKRRATIPSHWSLLWNSIQIWLGAAVGQYFFLHNKTLCL